MPRSPSPELLSETLLRLYEAARTPSVEAFQDKALEEISRVVPYDSSIWGVGTVADGQTIVKGAHVRNVAPEAVEILNRADARNVVGKVVRERPGIAHIFSSADTFEDPDTEALWSQLGGVREVLCHGVLDAKAGLIGFFSIARNAGGSPFTSLDARWIELLAPHLEATLQICRVSELQHHGQDRRADHSRRAVCDARGVLHVAEPGFTSLLANEWPRWQGPRLPTELLTLAGGESIQRYRKGTLNVTISGVPQQRLIVVTRKTLVDTLTRQERVVAEAFAEGLSYKEVAQRLRRSPATVRHHLRSVYLKLGVHDKGHLARVIFGE